MADPGRRQLGCSAPAVAWAADASAPRPFARHIYTRPYTPRTNGKAERFIQTLIREWADALPYPSSNKRAADLPRWLRLYNYQGPHGSLDRKPPISRQCPAH
ncbi:MAG: transposase [Proteobacteria bacterium]|nr:transposase [Pseudomonadota bacterium]